MTPRQQLSCAILDAFPGQVFILVTMDTSTGNVQTLSNMSPRDGRALIAAVAERGEPDEVDFFGVTRPVHG
ncbi:hypothetical protein JessAGP_010 [Caulobacter phage Jess A]|nr:hypothetical protein JessAGP_010 [Caulobacter phage Jess A]WCA46419.1 hypothetical protein [Caulobacter phage RapA]